MAGNLHRVKFILKHCNGININTADDSGNTPLIWASYKGRSEVVKLLLEEEGLKLDPGRPEQHVILVQLV